MVIPMDLEIRDIFIEGCRMDSGGMFTKTLMGELGEQLRNHPAMAGLIFNGPQL